MGPYPSGSMRLPGMYTEKKKDPESLIWMILMPQTHRPNFVKYWHGPTVISWLVTTRQLLNVRLERRKLNLSPVRSSQKPSRSQLRKEQETCVVSGFPHCSNTHSHKDLFCSPGFIFWSPWQCGNHLALHRDAAYFRWQELLHKDKGDKDGLGRSKT